jgi:hypothetical protein
MRFLAIILLAPWLLILCWAYWAYPKHMTGSFGRRAFDVIVLLLAAFATVQSAMLGYASAHVNAVSGYGRSSGAIWQQVLPALNGYGACIGVLLLAAIVRYLIWRRRM